MEVDGWDVNWVSVRLQLNVVLRFISRASVRRGRVRGYLIGPMTSDQPDTSAGGMLTRLRMRFWLPPRAHGDVIEDRTVSFLELFYDLVYVVVIAQATHTLADDPTWQKGGQFVVIFSLIWIAWLNGTLYYDLHGREDGRTRFFVFVQMGLLALLAVFTGHAADDTGSEFAIVYTLYLLVLAYLWWTVRRVDSDEYNRLTGQYLVANAVAIVIMGTSIFLDDQARVTLWTLFVVGYLLANIVINARTEILADITDSTVERFGLFTIIVLGEVVVGVVDGMSEVEIDALAVVTALLGLCVGFALWWTYFDFAGRRLPRRTSLSQMQWTTYFLLIFSPFPPSFLSLFCGVFFFVLSWGFFFYFSFFLFFVWHTV